MAAALASASEVSAAAHLPKPAALRMTAAEGGGQAVTAMRLEGVERSVAHRTQLLEDLVRALGPLIVLDQPRSSALWNEIRDVRCFAASGPTAQRFVWRISTAPAHGAELGRRLAAQTDVELAYDWAGGLIWAAIAPSQDAGEAIVRAAVAACGGHATLVRAPAAVRAQVAVFEPQPAPLAALTARVKQGFDPLGVLNPGRMWAGV
jgi:glycolate oxidase FAD binding subunit